MYDKDKKIGNKNLKMMCIKGIILDLNLIKINKKFVTSFTILLV